jgi:lysophospholipase L1-like esterase
VVLISVGLSGITLIMGCANNKGDSVAVLGDSITTFDQADMQQQLGGDFKLTTSGNFGKTVAEVMPEAEVVATRTYDQVIINLGTNDAIGHLPTADSKQSLEKMISLFNSAKCIHLVNINENMVDQANGQSVSAAAKELNGAIDDLAKANKQVSVIDWNSETAGTLNNKKPPWSTLTKDSVHPTGEGNKQLNTMYADALNDCQNPMSL